MSMQGLNSYRIVTLISTSTRGVNEESSSCWISCHHSGNALSAFLFLCTFLAGSSTGLQQWAHPVPSSYRCVEETSRGAAGLQHPRRQGVTVGNLYIQGVCSLGVFFSGIHTCCAADYFFAYQNIVTLNFCVLCRWSQTQMPTERGFKRETRSFLWMRLISKI